MQFSYFFLCFFALINNLQAEKLNKKKSKLNESELFEERERLRKTNEFLEKFNKYDKTDSSYQAQRQDKIDIPESKINENEENYVGPINDISAVNCVGEINIKNKTFKTGNFIGKTRLENSQADSLIITGPLNFNYLWAKELIIVGIMEGSQSKFEHLIVTGSLKGKRIQCKELNVTGPVNVTDLTVTGKSVITGILEAKQSWFEDMAITANIVTLIDTFTGTLKIMQDKDTHKTQIVKLKGHTIVKGDIVFESGKGIVEKDQKVEIHGKVIGAQIKVE